jgi:4-amino-4-deoxy-L-arabinose transferase-like glycosyltransferase
VMLLQIAAGAGIAVVAAALAERLFGGWIAGAAAGLLVAFHPGLALYAAAKAHPLTFDALFFTLALLQFMRLGERPTLGRALQLGAVIGVGMLSRSTIAIFFPVGAVWLFVTAPRGARRTVVGGLFAAGALAALILLPWSVRDALVQHRPVFLLTTTGEDFWDGNNPFATGHSYIDAGHTVIDALPPDEAADLRRQPDEVAQSQWFMDRARAFIRDNPAAFVRLTVSKFFHFWWFAPQTGVLYPRAWFRLYMAYYVGILLLALAGAWRLAGARGVAPALLLCAFLFALSALQSLYYVETRHRWAIEPMVLAVSGGGAAALIERRRGSGGRIA